MPAAGEPLLQPAASPPGALLRAASLPLGEPRPEELLAERARALPELAAAVKPQRALAGVSDSVSADAALALLVSLPVAGGPEAAGLLQALERPVPGVAVAVLSLLAPVRALAAAALLLPERAQATGKAPSCPEGWRLDCRY